ncbi:hypothetical protein [Corallococcus macrosporus]|uniref:Uncharacterized protein n=1 Tax=Myxococcus fulvus (strain ATCC BAA-855 / HW-1) TaxID=483219 RepID=F8CC21_MYXFH|nr:hypothetical protein [Corallococcus macrosporus]AEI67178.1 hypothetical protein LILAB_26430 [Corallococcus macrosporus]
MKGLFLGAASALALWGCANNDAGERSTDEYLEPAAERERESRARSDETVYDESATGGSGQFESVTNEAGTWDTMEEPGGDEPKLPSEQQQDVPAPDSVIIDEGPNVPLE